MYALTISHLHELAVQSGISTKLLKLLIMFEQCLVTKKCGNDAKLD